ncbi:1-deoxy-D-xylulose-5-phosphate synthase [Sedimentibacter sp. zth1]|uniref:1-deoxy-D-xylulose-5-phosphate synthase n=1 Tax=Sedimentibacter sp. zth1 TaxID=2816908 RepID=UPI001A930566|nr:1-deoxy-D-xylulose-5-phosphate synthase [Sedimentibacter sp. zth1]QSX06365.1 1-deoxy-D-xylulose-5-phosphate synthase [Sedimentibacter sp. zth1]
MNNILSKINTPEDLYNLSYKEMDVLSSEIREYLIDVVSKTGGHLASNLGVVELTIALEYAFNLERDKIIWDVGHQAYIHKILTGRKDKMYSIRQLGGISGFPKREESKYDIFDTGHSSTSISAAIGVARARDLNKYNYNVVSVIGDGALTGGMAFEALNDIGKTKTKVIVVLNDNEMSISKNVGGLSTHLSIVRSRTRYLTTKKDLESFLEKAPIIGKYIRKFLHTIKEGIKKMIIPSMLFEEIGFTYLGPIDGHDIEDLVEVFENAKNIDGPVLIHVCTKKGKGYKYAEEKPNNYHGVSPFDIETGLPLKKSNAKSYSKVFGDKLCEIAKTNKKVVAISAAMIQGTGLDKFSKMYRDRVFDVGIAEQHAVTMAAGMAVNGVTPVVALYSSFLQRAYDQVVHDVATQNLHVVFAIDRAGIVGNDGETHQGVFDTGFLVQIPNMIVMAPCDNQELEDMLEFAVNKHKGPISLRYPRGNSNLMVPKSYKQIELGKGVMLKEGKDITIVAYGKMIEIAIQVSDILSSKNISNEIINLRFLKPLDMALVNKSLSKTKNLLIIEETSIDASISYKIKSLIDSDINMENIIIKSFPDKFIRHGNVNDIFDKYELNAQCISKEIENLIIKK